MKWTELPFGKHTGKTLPQVLFIDPCWYCWAVHKGVFQFGPIEHDAELIRPRVSRIKVPGPAPGQFEVEYFFHDDGALADIRVVPRDQPRHSGSSTTIRHACFDFMVPYLYAPSNRKSAMKMLIKCIKYAYFGDANYKMTRARCDQFFSDRRNFRLKPTPTL